MNSLSWLQRWYERQCDGTWEHAYGIKIETLDNPGWHVQINLVGTPHDSAVRETAADNSETDWLRCSIQNRLFNGYGDPGKLEKIIEVFRGWVEPTASEAPGNP